MEYFVLNAAELLPTCALELSGLHPSWRRESFRPEPGKSRLLETRQEVRRGWLALGEILSGEGQQGVARDVMRFVGEMPVPRTEREQIVDALLQRIHQPRAKDHGTR